MTELGLSGEANSAVKMEGYLPDPGRIMGMLFRLSSFQSPIRFLPSHC